MLCVNKIKKIPLAIIAILFSAIAHAEKITIKAIDCGPLARGDLGVVFHTQNNGNRQTYFSRGSAQEVCPKILNNTAVIGYESGLCERNKPETPNECLTIKEFVILRYQSE